jgi:thiol:disulfide interchange protein DsbG
MNRRGFLSLLALAGAQPATADMLTGESPLDGERPMDTWLAAQKLASLQLAPAGALIQIAFFVDPNCPACAKLWAWFDSRPRPELASLWVPVAYMKPSSEGRAAALLRAANPHAALAQNYGPQFDHAAWEGAIPVAKNVMQNERAHLNRNTRFWKSLFGSTPLMLYRQADGTIQQTLGVPPGGLDPLISRLAPTKLKDFAPQ